MLYLPNHDPKVAEIVRLEEARIEDTLDLIAAENHAPRSIFEAQGSIFSPKAAEGYPGNRFHAGCRNADTLERLAIERARRLFGAVIGQQTASANVQYGIQGQQAPEMNLETWIDGDGERVDPIFLSDYRGKVIYLYFFQDW